MPSTEEYIAKIKSETDPISKARLLSYLHKEKDIRIVDLSNLLNLSPSYICNFIRLTRLPEIIIDGYYTKTISLTHLLIISRLKNRPDAVSLYEKVLTHNYTVIQTDAAVSEILYQIKTVPEKLSEKEKGELIHKFQKLDKAVEVTIVQTQVSGKLTLRFKGNRKKTSEVFKKISDL